MRDNITYSCTPPPPGRRRVLGFTLAEVLITLGIIGIVAVLILPDFIENHTKRVWERQDWAVQHKLTLATDEMKGLGLIGYYDSTESFVNVLKKYFKIVQVCKNDNLGQCWPTKTITREDGSEVNVSDLKTGKQLNPKGGWTRNNLGVLTADGTSIIMSYKDNCDALDPLKSYLWDSAMKTNATTSCIAMIYDLNGKGRPNKSGQDVRLFNAASLGKSFECKNALGICLMTSDLSYKPLSKTECETYKDELGILCSDVNENSYAGAIKACMDLGGRLMTRAEADKVAKELNKENDPFNLIHTGMASEYWVLSASSEPDNYGHILASSIDKEGGTTTWSAGWLGSQQNGFGYIKARCVK